MARSLSQAQKAELQKAKYLVTELRKDSRYLYHLIHGEVFTEAVLVIHNVCWNTHELIYILNELEPDSNWQEIPGWQEIPASHLIVYLIFVFILGLAAGIYLAYQLIKHGCWKVPLPI